MAVTGQTAGLAPELMNRLIALSARLNEDIHVTSGLRNGPITESAHNSGIAADVKVRSMDTVGMADALVDAGFTGVGEYYAADGQTREAIAHGDIRGLPGSEGAGPYAIGGPKSRPLCWTGVGIPRHYTYGRRRSGHRCPPGTLIDAVE